jgi:translation initiation factor IF-2
MSDKTVQELAEVVGIPLDRFLEQLKEAGLSASAADDTITEDEKVKLLAHLRKRHGKADSDEETSPKRITLKRSTKTELKQSSSPGGAAKTVSIEVRKQKTYIKRNEPAAEATEVATPAPVVAEIKTEQETPAIAPVVEAVEQKQEPVAAPQAEPTISIEAETTPVVEAIAEPIEKAPVAPAKPAMSEEERLEYEKKQRLEAAVQRTAEKVKKQAEAKQQQTLHKKKQEFKPTRGPAQEVEADR